MNWQEKIDNYHINKGLEQTKTEEENQRKKENQILQENVKYYNEIVVPSLEILDTYNTKQILESFNKEIFGDKGTVSKQSATFSEISKKGIPIEKCVQYKLEINYLDYYPGHSTQSAGWDSDDIISSTPPSLILKDISFVLFYEEEKGKKYLSSRYENIVKYDQYDHTGYVQNNIELSSKTNDEVKENIESILINFHDKVKKYHLSDEIKDLIQNDYQIPNGWEKGISKDEIEIELAKLELIKKTKSTERILSSNLDIQTNKKRSFLDKLFGNP